jgi:hypothetical protein
MRIDKSASFGPRIGLIAWNVTRQVMLNTTIERK